MHIAGIDMSKQRVFMMVTAAEALVSSFLDLTRILEYLSSAHFHLTSCNIYCVKMNDLISNIGQRCIRNIS